MARSGDVLATRNVNARRVAVRSIAWLDLLRDRSGFADMMIPVVDAECAQTLPQPLRESEKTLG